MNGVIQSSKPADGASPETMISSRVMTAFRNDHWCGFLRDRPVSANVTVVVMPCPNPFFCIKRGNIAKDPATKNFLIFL